MRLVLDTNVIVSALFWGGIPRNVLEEAQQLHTLCFNEETLIELRAVLTHTKFEKDVLGLSFTIEEFLQRLTEHAIIVNTVSPFLNVIKDDPSDDKFLACARAARADFIVSGDKHLLALKTLRGIPILTPRQSLARTKRRRN